MTRGQLEHLVRAAATIADDREIVVIGSQAVLGQFPQAPAELLVSVRSGRRACEAPASAVHVNENARAARCSSRVGADPPVAPSNEAGVPGPGAARWV